MPDNPFRLAVVGAGPWAERYLHTIDSLSDVTVAAVVSRALQTGARARSGVFADRAVVADIEALDPARVDGAVVAVPPHAMLSVCSALIDFKIAFLVEKPFSLSSVTASNLRNSACAAGVPAMVDLIYLFNPGYRLVKEIVRSGGGVQGIKSVGGGPGPYRPDVPAVWDWAPHDLSMILDLIGADPVEITLASVTGDIKDHVVSVDLSFSHGINATMTVGNRMHEKRRDFACHGSFGDAMFQEQPRRLVRHGEIDLDVDQSAPLANVISTFVDCARGIRDPMNTMDVACRTNKLIENIFAKISAEVVENLA